VRSAYLDPRGAVVRGGCACFVSASRFASVAIARHDAHGTMGNVVSGSRDPGCAPPSGPSAGLQLPASRRAWAGTRTERRGEGESEVGGGRASWGRGLGRGAAPARGRRNLRCGSGPRGRPWSGSALTDPVALGRDAGQPGARRGREVEPAGTANAKLAGAVVPVRARGRAAPLAAAALPAARPRLRGRSGR
jgi:hypothetical protein